MQGSVSSSQTREAPLSLERFGSRCLRRRHDAVFCPRVQLPNHQEQLHPSVMTAPSPGLSATAMLLSAGFPGAPRWLVMHAGVSRSTCTYGSIRATSHRSFVIPDEHEGELRCETERDRGIPSGWGGMQSTETERGGQEWVECDCEG